MEVYTTEPGVQVYTSNWHNGFEGAHGATFPARSAICFEAQHFPDTPNKGHFPSCVLHPGETYNQVTIYKFGVENNLLNNLINKLIIFQNHESTKQNGNIIAIITMFFLFAMISFVTNLAAPFGTIWKTNMQVPIPWV